MFDRELAHIEPKLRAQLELLLESTIREIYNRYDHSRKDYSIVPLTGDEINARIRGIFDLVRNLRPIPSGIQPKKD